MTIFSSDFPWPRFRPPGQAGRATRWLRLVALVLSAVAAFAAVQTALLAPQPALAAPRAVAAPKAAAAPKAVAATSYAPISGAGSTWAYPAIHAWIGNLNQYGMTIEYAENGSSEGRNWFGGGQVDWAASEIPYGVQDGTTNDPPPGRGYDYMPDVAGGTTLMYNLKIDGVRVTNLRLSGATAAGIFTNKITMWNAPQIKADNPGLDLPALPITPVVRSDGSGATADFTQWMLATQPSYWQAYCKAVDWNPCTQTSVYPVQKGTAMIGQPGDPGVAQYVAQASSDGAIGYVEYSWAKQEEFPVAALLNADGYYTEPTPGHVAVSLLQDKINTDKSSPLYLTQDLSGVYTNKDPRNYELSAYSYFIWPTDMSHNMTTAKGYTIGAFGTYALCLGQSQVDVLGYSALPINLVEDGFDQLRKVPGAQIPSEDLAAIAQCHNPTFSTNGTNTLADDDPKPPACDHQGPTQCSSGDATIGSGGSVSGGGSGSGGGGSGSGGSGSGGSGSGGSGSGGSGGSGTGATVTGPSSGATGSAGSTGSGQSCDPNTGVCGTSGASTGTGDGSADTGSGSLAGSDQSVSDTPITLAGSNGDGLQVTLMALAAGLFFLIGVVPPLLAQAGKRSRQRRGIDQFYDDADRTGHGR